MNRNISFDESQQSILIANSGETLNAKAAKQLVTKLGERLDQ